jgi:hypothetical protein
VSVQADNQTRNMIANQSFQISPLKVCRFPLILNLAGKIYNATSAQTIFLHKYNIDHKQRIREGAGTNRTDQRLGHDMDCRYKLLEIGTYLRWNFS